MPRFARPGRRRRRRRGATHVMSRPGRSVGCRQIARRCTHTVYTVQSPFLSSAQSCAVLCCAVLCCAVLWRYAAPLLSYQPQSYCAILSCPILSCPVLSCPVLSCPSLVPAPVGRLVRTSRRQMAASEASLSPVTAAAPSCGRSALLQTRSQRSNQRQRGTRRGRRHQRPATPYTGRREGGLRRVE